MSTLSVPLTKELEVRLEKLIDDGVAPNKAAVMRKALEKLAEDEAVNTVLRAMQEPTLRGDFRELAKKLK